MTAPVLAAANQIFSLLAPRIFRYIIDNCATKYTRYSSAQFIGSVTCLLAAAVGVAFVSRVAKNFRDYFVNPITQQVGARIYADGIRHSLELPYTLFEDPPNPRRRNPVLVNLSTLGKVRGIGQDRPPQVDCQNLECR